MKWITVAAAMLATSGCGTTSTNAIAQNAPRSHHHRSATWVHELPAESVPVEPQTAAPADAPPSDPWRDPMATLDAAAARAQPGARRVLQTIHAMLDEATVVRGSCYTWVSALYRRAGGHPAVVFQGDRRASFATPEVLEPGDWVFFINHSFGDVTHSAVFVAWIDQAARNALMVSYPGGNRRDPGRFGDYELSNVYQIVRMGDALVDAPARHGASRHARRDARSR